MTAAEAGVTRVPGGDSRSSGALVRPTIQPVPLFLGSVNGPRHRARCPQSPNGGEASLGAGGPSALLCPHVLHLRRAHRASGSRSCIGAPSPRPGRGDGGGAGARGRPHEPGPAADGDGARGPAGPVPLRPRDTLGADVLLASG